MKRWLRRLAVFVFVVAPLIALGLAAGAWWLIQQPWGTPGAETTFVARPGQSAREILIGLESAGVVRDARLARLYLVHVLGDPPLLAGEYRFKTPATLDEVLSKLIRGDVVTYVLTLIEGLTLDETAEEITRQGFGDRAALRREMSDPGRIADLDPAAVDLEGYLFPDSYQFARGTPESEIVSTLVRTFRKRWRAQVEPRLGTGPPPSVREIVILASIVEKEARLDEERPRIAGVYRNRLEQGIALYADPTVIFALKLKGLWNGNLRRPDLRFDSPYNTYVYAGLPPGPICSPGAASLTAAAAPEDVPYLYFVSRNDGSHVFAETLAEHNRNVEEHQRRYWQRRWAEEAEQR